MKAFLLASISILLFCSFTGDGEFQKVKNATQNTVLKKKLLTFEKSGIERNTSLSNEVTADSIVKIAYKYLHTPHRMGGTTKKGIDCSGLVYATFRQIGVELPHSSHEQAKYGHIIANKSDLQKGDLLYFHNSYNSHNLITHTGIYLGNGQFIHTSHSSGVVISSIVTSKYWKSRLLFGTRHINAFQTNNEPTVIVTDSTEESY